MLKRMLIFIVATAAFPLLSAPNVIVNCGLTVEAEAPRSALMAFEVSLSGQTLDYLEGFITVGKEKVSLKLKGAQFKPKLEKYTDKAVSLTYGEGDKAPTLLVDDGGSLGSIERITYFNDSPIEMVGERKGSVIIELTGTEITRLTFAKCRYTGADSWKRAFKQE